ncbi:MAG: endonuclease/exonuclease/phosphatase family protein [Sphingomonadales bacterium]|nr:endonuclease/exonuclease/phosphatase family protein [Sphingomonadales bacterium]
MILGRLTFGLLVAMTAMGLLGMSPAADARVRQVCAPGSEFRVITYNIRLDTPADGMNQWAHRRTLLVQQVRLLKPDILGLQEVVPQQRADLVHDLPALVWVGGGRDDGALQGEASPLLINGARFRIAGSGMFWLSPTPQRPSLGWDASYRRVATWARLTDRTNGTRILAINTHWDHLGVQARLESARLLRRWIAANRQPGEAVVLLGDFNAPLEEPSLQTVLSPASADDVLRDARTASLEPAVGVRYTFNGYQPVPSSGAIIDHILVGGRLAVVRYHALGEHFDGRLASDHFPVIADLAAYPAVKGCAAGSPAS